MNDTIELRFYCFVNFYLSSIQQGIQTGHAAVDLVRKYALDGEEDPSVEELRRAAVVVDWADNHKTFIILNGGDNDGISHAQNIISATDLPWAKFHESEGALDGLRTCVGAVIPDFIFNATLDVDLTKEMAARFDDKKIYSFTCENESGFDPKIVFFPDDRYYALIELLRSSRLAS